MMMILRQEFWFAKAKFECECRVTETNSRWYVFVCAFCHFIHCMDRKDFFFVSLSFLFVWNWTHFLSISFRKIAHVFVFRCFVACSIDEQTSTQTFSSKGKRFLVSRNSWCSHIIVCPCCSRCEWQMNCVWQRALFPKRIDLACIMRSKCARWIPTLTSKNKKRAAYCNVVVQQSDWGLFYLFFVLFWFDLIWFVFVWLIVICNIEFRPFFF